MPLNKKTLLLIIVLTTLFVPVIVFADGGGGTTKSVSLDNPLGETTQPQVLIGSIISAVLGIVGSLALVMFIYGGVVWMTSSGSAEKVDKGKNILVWATIGLVVIFSAYALVKFVFTSLGV